MNCGGVCVRLEKRGVARDGGGAVESNQTWAQLHWNGTWLCMTPALSEPWRGAA